MKTSKARYFESKIQFYTRPVLGQLKKRAEEEELDRGAERATTHIQDGEETIAITHCTKCGRLLRPEMSFCDGCHVYGNPKTDMHSEENREILENAINAKGFRKSKNTNYTGKRTVRSTNSRKMNFMVKKAWALGFNGMEDLMTSDMSDMKTTNKLALEEPPIKMNYVDWAIAKQKWAIEEGKSRQDWIYIDTCAAEHRAKEGKQKAPKTAEYREKNYPDVRDKQKWAIKSKPEHPPAKQAEKRVASNEPPQPPPWKRTEVKMEDRPISAVSRTFNSKATPLTTREQRQKLERDDGIDDYREVTRTNWPEPQNEGYDGDDGDQDEEEWEEPNPPNVNYDGSYQPVPDEDEENWPGTHETEWATSDSEWWGKNWREEAQPSQPKRNTEPNYGTSPWYLAKECKKEY